MLSGKMSCAAFAVGLTMLLLSSGKTTTLFAQADGNALVESATGVLNEVMAVPAKQIPASLLNQAQGIAIIPNVVKGGFVIGARYGRGVVLIRDGRGNWQPPKFITLTGGSVGWQAGVQSTDVVLVFKTRNSVGGLMRGKLTIGADASASAGPVGRNLSAATDTQLKSEIYSYSRSRGLFLGVALDGSGIQVDPVADAAYYRSVSATGGPVGQLPGSATRLMETVARYSGGGQVVAAPNLTPRAFPVATEADAQMQQREAVRRELAGAAGRLNALLDANWRGYLALPREVYIPDHQTNAVELRNALTRYDTVAANPQYRLLVERPEFQAVAGFLRKYIQVLETPTSNALSLPPPPAQPQPQPSAFLPSATIQPGAIDR